MKLLLKLYPGEFFELFSYLQLNPKDQAALPLVDQHVGKLVMINYLASWTSERIYAWKHRRADKQFALRLPAVVGLAIYQDIKSRPLTVHQQFLLGKLDQAIINYQNPYAQRGLSKS